MLERLRKIFTDRTDIEVSDEKAHVTRRKSSEAKGARMRKVSEVFGLIALALGTMVLSANPAYASCETELGDMCHAYGVICRSAVNEVCTLDKFVDCPNW